MTVCIQSMQALIPVLHWSWIEIFIFTLVIDWGIVSLLHQVQPKKFSRARWKTATYGDIFLPIGIASSCAIAAQLHGSGAWYTKTWWGLAVLLSGLAINLIMEVLVLHFLLKQFTTTQQLAPSNVWHTIIFAPLFYLCVVSSIPAIIIHHPLHLVIGMIVGYGGWLMTFLYDFWRSPVKRLEKTRSGGA